MVGGFDEDVRLVAGAAQHALDAEHLVADRVAVAERRQHLMDLHQARLRASWRGAPLTPRAGPLGRLASTSRAGGTFSRRRSARPGSSTVAVGACVWRRRSSMSRYFRSM